MSQTVILNQLATYLELTSQHYLTELDKEKSVLTDPSAIQKIEKRREERQGQ